MDSFFLFADCLFISVNFIYVLEINDMDCFKLKGFNKILTNYMPQKLEFDFRKGSCITVLSRNFYFSKKTLQCLEFNLIHWTLLFNNLYNFI